MGYPIYHSQYTAAQIEAAIGKGPRVNTAGYWEVWNVGTGAYESTGVGAGVTPPTVVTQAADMTNHGYIYIYNGAETGYTAGYWYYWDGSAWTAGGAYQVAATDPTLTVAGAAADAKAAGDKLGELKSAISDLFNGFDFGWVNGYIRGSDGAIVSGNTSRTSVAFPFSFFPSFIIDSDAFKSVPTYNYFGLWSNGGYVGYWRNGKFYLPTNVETESIAFDAIRVVMSTASSPSYETLSFESVIEKFDKYVAIASLPGYSFDYPITKTINIRANVGYVKLNGTTGASQAGLWEHSDFIAIEPSYKVTYYVLGATNVASVSFYDASQTIMPAYNVVAPDGTNMISGTVEAPDGAKFVRVCGFYANHTNEYAESETPITLGEVVQKVATNTNGSFWSGKTIGFLGDSITEGLYTEVGELAPDKKAAKPYPIIVGEVLDAIILNYGVSGTSISSTTDTKPSKCFIARAPGMTNDLDLVVVLGGTNDYVTSVPLGTAADTTDVSFYGALDVLCNLLIAKYPSKRVVFVTPLLRDYMGHGEGANNLGYTLEDIRKAITDVASDRYGLMVLDGKKVGISPYNATWRATYIYDGLHPNPIGHELLGKNLARMLSAV